MTRASTSRLIGIAITVIVAVSSWTNASSAACMAFHATKPLPKVTITGKVLIGDAKAFHAVGVVDRKIIFDSIPAIRALKREQVQRDTARFHFLIYEANRVFQRALDTAAKEQGVDFVVEAGGLSAAGIKINDLTELTRKLVLQVR